MADYTFGIGEELQFTSQDGDLIHTWDFGDNSAISSLPGPSHIYTNLGIYTITHIAKDFCDTCLNVGSHTVQIAEASIAVKSLLLDKYSINVGDTVTATIIVQNTSLVYGTGTVTLKFAGQTVDTRDVKLNPGEVTSYTVVYQAIRSGTIDVCADNLCTVLFVESMISVVSIIPTPAISTGEAINATIDVKNNGTFTEEKEIRTTLTNSSNQVTIEDTRLINLIAGATQTYTVPIDVRNLPNGTYILCADGKCKAISIAISAPTGSLNIVSAPSGAEVWFGTEDKGVKTDTTITDIASGDVTFTLKLANYNDTNGIITIIGGMTSYVYTSLVPKEATTGSISISSIPTNADIYIDGSPQLDSNGYQLKTPATISGIDPGPHSVTLKLSGYENYNTLPTSPINIVAGITTFLSVAMLRSPITVGDISITSNPAGAEILIDGSNTGKITPDTIKDASIGQHNFTLIKDGYSNVLGQIDVVGGTTSYIYVVMVPIAPTVGGISITSTPSGADIYIDGNVQPTITPATIPNLTPITHTITLKLSGYEDFTRSVNIIAGITTYLDTVLTPIPITIGSIDFTSYPIGAQIWLDGSNTGRTTPYTIANISVGNHTFILKLYGYNNTTGSITVIGGAISYVYAILSITEAITGSLSISSVPTGADIYIDGLPQLDINNQPIRTPNTISNLNPGNHDITLKLSGYNDFNISTNIVVGQTSYISVSMTIVPSTIGNINFMTIPDNVEIMLDGSNTGKTTPDILTGISIGSHTFILKKSGYDNATGPIIVIGGVTSYIYAIMVPVSVTTGSLSISSIPQNADIYLDGILQLDNNRQPLKTPATLINLYPGAYTIKLKKTGYIDFTTPVPIDVIVGQTSYLGVILSTLQVMEAGVPWWFIFSLATGTIYGMLQPKKIKEVNQLKLITGKR